MKRIFSRFLVLMLATGVSSLALAQEKQDAHVVISGWITDTHCGAMGAKEGHGDCAASCVTGAGRENRVTKHDSMHRPRRVRD